MIIVDVEEIRRLVSLKDGRLSPRSIHILKHKHFDLYQAIIDKTKFLNETSSLAIRLYCIKYNITAYPLCPICNSPTKWLTNKGIFATACSVKHATQLDIVKNKRNKTNIQKYGTVCAANTPKTNKTMIQKYGVSHPLQVSKFQQKRKQTMNQKYGTDNINLIPEIFEKRKTTTAHNWNRNWTTQRNMPDHSIQCLASKEWLTEYHVNQKKSCVTLAKELGVGITTVTRAINRFDLLHTFSGSTYEHTIAKILDNCQVLYTKNTRHIIQPHELDFFCKSERIAIEICGHYWHGELMGKDRTYHLNKHELCKAQDIRLITIFENEILHFPEIVKSRLLYAFNKNKQFIGARKCNIKPVSSSDASLFLQQNHIQGSAQATYMFGLWVKEELVAIMTFGKPRFNREHDLELIRFASRGVVGAASKLFKYAINVLRPNSVISYSDRRWNVGSLYHMIGFQYTHSSSPSYFYFKRNQSTSLYNRLQFQKHKLLKLYPQFNNTLTEWEIMIRLGYDRIWDCGTDVWVWIK